MSTRKTHKNTLITHLHLISWHIPFVISLFSHLLQLQKLALSDFCAMINYDKLHFELFILQSSGASVSEHHHFVWGTYNTLKAILVVTVNSTRMQCKSLWIKSVYLMQKWWMINDDVSCMIIPSILANYYTLYESKVFEQ